MLSIEIIVLFPILTTFLVLLGAGAVVLTGFLEYETQDSLETTKLSYEL